MQERSENRPPRTHLRAVTSDGNAWENDWRALALRRQAKAIEVLTYCWSRPDGDQTADEIVRILTGYARGEAPE